MKHVTLEGDFIRLEPLTMEHLPALEKQFDPMLFAYYPKPYSTAREFVEENLEMQKKGNFLPFAIIHKPTGEAVGCTEFSAIDEKNRKLEIGGSWLRQSVHGTAANSEAKYLMLWHAFDSMEFVRVQFTAHVQNVRSRTGIERIGARLEGILRSNLVLPDGTLRDDACYSVISQEWPEVKAALEQRIEKKLNFIT